MAGKVKLPMGIENFREIRTGGFYYVDKTGLIKTLMENPGKVNLFTRPLENETVCRAAELLGKHKQQ